MAHRETQTPHVTTQLPDPLDFEFLYETLELRKRAMMQFVGKEEVRQAGLRQQLVIVPQQDQVKLARAKAHLDSIDRLQQWMHRLASAAARAPKLNGSRSGQKKKKGGGRS